MLDSIIFIIVSARLLIGWALDMIFGDPTWLPHPVVWMGKWIAMGERMLNKGRWRMTKGAIFAVGSIMLTYLLVHALLITIESISLSNHIPETGHIALDMVLIYAPYTLVSAILIFFCLAGKTLRKEVKMVFEAVDRSVENGRIQVARIVGRDTRELSAQECRTAALETLAENLSDGVVAPLFWMMMLGVPGMVAYKMVNTLDSMIGYKTERYREFGCWAARIDDIANYIPARLTAFLIMAAYLCLSITGNSMGTQRSTSFLFRFVHNNARNHASPNSGWPESALAGVLDCRFGGGHTYFGEYIYKPYIGMNARKLTTSDMHLSLRISLVTETLMIIIFLSMSALSLYCQH